MKKIFKAGKHTGSAEDIAHYKHENGGISFSNYNWFYLLPRIFMKKRSIDVYWLCYGWTVWEKSNGSK